MTENLDPETGFLEQLGQRVRTMRALRGMSRKVLAKVSGISERYIAQLGKRQGQRLDRAAAPGVECDGRASRRPHSRNRAFAGLARHSRSRAQGDANQIAQAKDALAGQGNGASAQRRMSFAGIALIGLPRRRQIHARQNAGERRSAGVLSS